MTLIQLRRGTAAEWTSVNPVLHAGEPGVELNTGFEKIGDGTTHWNDLPYTKGAGSGASAHAYVALVLGANQTDWAGALVWSGTPKVVGTDLEPFEHVPASGNFDRVRVLTTGMYHVQYELCVTPNATASGVVVTSLGYTVADSDSLMSYGDNASDVLIRPGSYESGDGEFYASTSYPIYRLEADDVVSPFVTQTLAAGSITAKGATTHFDVVRVA